MQENACIFLRRTDASDRRTRYHEHYEEGSGHSPDDFATFLMKSRPRRQAMGKNQKITYKTKYFAPRRQAMEKKQKLTYKTKYFAPHQQTIKQF